MKIFDDLSDAEIHDHSDSVRQSPYWNADIAPVSRSRRTWNTRDMAALWIGMSAGVPTYMLASSLVALGMDWRQSSLTLILGSFVVLVPMVLNAHAGTKYGIPFSVYCRASFGLKGANVPALLRALIACGWFGIQTWIGGGAIYKLAALYLPSITLDPAVFGGLNAAQWLCFLAFWGVNMFVIHKGIESIRLILNVKAPILFALGLAILAWAWTQTGSLGAMLSAPSAFAPGRPQEGEFWHFFFPALTATIGFWATLSLNIPDFSRHAHSQKSQALGQAIGLPLGMGLLGFIGAATTSATLVLYGKALWDPVDLLGSFHTPLVHAAALLGLCLATLAVNVATNVVGPANDFSHLWPEKIDFRTGGFLTAVVGVLIQPWRLIHDPSGYLFKWLIASSALLGAIGGVLICDYFFLRGQRLHVRELYEPYGEYWYSDGVNGRAMAALALGCFPVLPGFLGAVGLIEVAVFWTSLYRVAWFVSFGVAFVAYLMLMKWGED